MDFILLETESNAEECKQIPIILGRSFVAIVNTLINCKSEEMKLSFSNMTLELNVLNMCKWPSEKEDDNSENEDIELMN